MVKFRNYNYVKDPENKMRFPTYHEVLDRIRSFQLKVNITDQLYLQGWSVLDDEVGPIAVQVANEVPDCFWSRPLMFCTFCRKVLRDKAFKQSKPATHREFHRHTYECLGLFEQPHEIFNPVVVIPSDHRTPRACIDEIVRWNDSLQPLFSEMPPVDNPSYPLDTMDSNAPTVPPEPAIDVMVPIGGQGVSKSMPHTPPTVNEVFELRKFIVSMCVVMGSLEFTSSGFRRVPMDLNKRRSVGANMTASSAIASARMALGINPMMSPNDHIMHALQNGHLPHHQLAPSPSSRPIVAVRHRNASQIVFRLHEHAVSAHEHRISLCPNPVSSDLKRKLQYLPESDLGKLKLCLSKVAKLLLRAARNEKLHEAQASQSKQPSDQSRSSAEAAARDVETEESGSAIPPVPSAANPVVNLYVDEAEFTDYLLQDVGLEDGSIINIQPGGPDAPITLDQDDLEEDNDVMLHSSGQPHIPGFPPGGLPFHPGRPLHLPNRGPHGHPMLPPQFLNMDAATLQSLLPGQIPPIFLSNPQLQNPLQQLQLPQAPQSHHNLSKPDIHLAQGQSPPGQEQQGQQSQQHFGGPM